jgi:hypothetical protein
MQQGNNFPGTLAWLLSFPRDKTRPQLEGTQL